jgi:hypothetical protein
MVEPIQIFVLCAGFMSTIFRTFYDEVPRCTGHESAGVLPALSF